MKIHHVLFGLAFVALVGCKEPDSHEDAGSVDTALAEQIRLCEEVCLKPFCNPTVDPALGNECGVRCADTVAQAREQLCLEEYEALLECLEPLSCDDFYRWLQREPGTSCVVDEDQLRNQCPEVEIRTEGG